MQQNEIKPEKVLFAAGCFWGVEHFFQNLHGVLATTVGYTGGETENPSYHEVCSGQTGHVEAVEVVFNPAEISFKELAMRFFEMHNPARPKMESGKRSQYRSAVFCFSAGQAAIVKELIEQLRQKGIAVATEVKSAEAFYKAEERHQDYYRKRGSGYTGRVCTPRF